MMHGIHVSCSLQKSQTTNHIFIHSVISLSKCLGGGGELRGQGEASPIRNNHQKGP